MTLTLTPSPAQCFDDRDYNVQCKHPIPFELAMKIVSKIRSRERFSVYVMIPMYSEGIAESKALQMILYWQAQTVSMMYKVLHRVLGVLHRVLGLLHRVLGVLHRVLRYYTGY